MRPVMPSNNPVTFAAVRLRTISITRAGLSSSRVTAFCIANLSACSRATLARSVARSSSPNAARPAAVSRRCAQYAISH